MPLEDGCPVCGGACTPTPAHEHLSTNPFLTGGRDPMAGQLAGIDFVYAENAIYDRSPGVERAIYGAGDPVPMADAIRLGLVEGPHDPPAEPRPRGRRSGSRSKRPTEDRAKRPEEDEAKPQGEDR